MAQLMCMDARLDTLSDELCKVNTHVGRIMRRQAVMRGFTVASFPPKASKDESDDGSDNANNVEDGDDGSPSDDEMST